MPKKRTLSEAEAAALFGDDLLKKARARWERKAAPARAQWDGSRPPAPEPPPPSEDWNRSADAQADEWERMTAKPVEFEPPTFEPLDK